MYARLRNPAPACSLERVRIVLVAQRAARLIIKSSRKWNLVAAMKGAKLDQIEGARALAAVWVVVHHMLRVDTRFDDERGGEPAPETPFNAGLARAHVGVSFFVVLSGFITHWVYGRPQRWDGDLVKFYVGRLDRVLLTATLSLLVGALLGQALHVVTPLTGAPADLTVPRLLSCLTYVCYYIDPQQVRTHASLDSISLFQHRGSPPFPGRVHVPQQPGLDDRRADPVLAALPSVSVVAGLRRGAQQRNDRRGDAAACVWLDGHLRCPAHHVCS